MNRVDKPRIGEYQTPKTPSLQVPKGEKDHITLQHRSAMLEWVQWGYIACPGAITNEGTVNLVKDAKELPSLISNNLATTPPTLRVWAPYPW